MSGICAAVSLLHNGFSDFIVYEKAHEVGGTWRENTYPGLTCDVPSRLYQFTFDPNPSWSRLFSPGAEIQNYFVETAQRSGVLDHIRFGTKIISADFDGRGWVLRSDDGTTNRVDFLITATGVLHHPRTPDIAGLEEFVGPVFHSARWDHAVETTNRRIAVIGTGSTGAQLVCGLTGSASTVTLFQRTAQWVLPIPNPRYRSITRRSHSVFRLLDTSAYHLYRKVFELLAGALVAPGWRRRGIGALCRAHLRTVRDPELRRQLTPDYEPMCKRLVISGGFYRAVQRDDVELITAAIEGVEAHGIRTVDGVLHEVDVIVFATGFDAHAFLRPMKLKGRDGITVDGAWRNGPFAFRTVALPGFPNLFMLLGPHSPVGNYPLTAIAESQTRYIIDWLKRWRHEEFDTIEPTETATDDYNRMLTDAMPGTVWTTGCDSWYLDANGLPQVWPFTPTEHRSMLSSADPENYVLTRVLSGTGS